MRCIARRRRPTPMPACACARPSTMTKRPRDFMQALQLRPDFAEAAFQLADLEFQHGQLPEARSADRQLTSATTRRRRTCCCSRCVSRAPRTIAAAPSAMRAGCSATSRAPTRRVPWRRSTTTPAERLVSEAGGEPVRGIGARLRAAREKHGLDGAAGRREAARRRAACSKPSRPSNIRSLGAAVYVRGHLRRYADLIGESPAELQELYEETTDPLEPGPDPHSA